jgi:hypothetical protein
MPHVILSHQLSALALPQFYLASGHTTTDYIYTQTVERAEYENFLGHQNRKKFSLNIPDLILSSKFEIKTHSQLLKTH